jgi:hypothetical protein
MSTICSHVWIDPNDAPHERAPFSPVVGPGRREMKPGHTYVCQHCASILTVPTRVQALGQADGD